MIRKATNQMIYVEAPDNQYLGHYFDSSCKWRGKKSVFLAGGIMQCPPWQKDMVNLLKDEENLVLLNPRRENFPMGDPNAETEQITWEHDMLEEADAILYWFSPPTNNPIVFYELGKFINTNKDIFIGVHPDFERKSDVRIQVGLIRPGLRIVHTLEDLAAQVKEYVR